MTAAITTAQPRQQSALAIMASKVSVDPNKLLSTLKATVFKGASDDELLALVVVSNTYGLNPLLKEIYAFPAKGGGIVPVVSIDGWIRMTNDHPRFDGMELDVEFCEGKPHSATCKIHRTDRSRPTIVTEYFSECYRNTDPWNKCPARMLRHKALIQCARVAFGFSGVVDEDDGAFIAGERNVTPKSNPLTAMSADTPALADMSETQAPATDTASTRKAALLAIADTLKGYGLDLMGVLPEIVARGHITEGASASAVLKLPVATLETIATQADAIGAEAKERKEGTQP